MTRRSQVMDMSFREVFANPPAVVAKTAKKKGPEAARKQKVAISLNKARARGARIPKPK